MRLLSSSGRALAPTVVILAMVGCQDTGLVATEISAEAEVSMHYPGYGNPVNLGTLYGGTSAAALDINAHGVVVGWSSTTVHGETQIHATVWGTASGAASIADLGTLPGHTWSSANGINDQGVIVGTSCVAVRLSCRGFRWSQSGGMVTLKGWELLSSGANAINDAGYVVGWYHTNGTAHAVLWRPDGSRRDLDPNPTFGGALSRAWDISDNGYIAGEHSGTAYFWMPYGEGGAGSLGSLGGKAAGLAVDNHGIVVGESDDSVSHDIRPFGWSLLTGMVPLEVAPGGWDGHAEDITNAGLIVGRVSSTAFVLQNHQWGTLATLGGVSAGANAANECGSVVGFAFNPAGYRKAVIWPHRGCL